jgi:oligoribonuclease
MMFDDLANPIPTHKLPKFHCYVLRPQYTGEPYALSMHPEIFRRIAARDTFSYNFIKEEELASRISAWCKEFFPRKYPTIAGKNFGSFDLPFLKALPEADEFIKFKHRVLDVGCLYVRKTDEALPDLDECLSRAKINGAVNHTAMNEAELVVKLVRRKLLR